MFMLGGGGGVYFTLNELAARIISARVFPTLLIMYAKSITLTKQNSVSVTGLMRIEAPPKHDQKTSKARCFPATGIQRNTMVR